ncbi:MAG TPA: NAD-dependent epimerase/dehydratase family protein, partial [Candidatus Krumholzibacteria bacterium]|nr:NAD-dependent epimerase/dehydratase family protein [Candidatus Krumholzibacteria bacterium]
AEQVVWDAGVAEAVVLRIALVYGPGVGGNLRSMLDAIDRRRFPPPPPVPNRRSMIHVDDVVRVMIAAGERVGVAGHTLVVSDGVPYSTRAVYEAMVRALGRSVPAWWMPVPCWRMLARTGDAVRVLTGRRAPFDSDAYRKLFGSAWYQPSNLQAELGIAMSRTLADAVPEMMPAR